MNIDNDVPLPKTTRKRGVKKPRFEVLWNDIPIGGSQHFMVDSKYDTVEKLHKHLQARTYTQQGLPEGSRYKAAMVDSDDKRGAGVRIYRVA